MVYKYGKRTRDFLGAFLFLLYFTISFPYFEDVRTRWIYIQRAVVEQFLIRFFNRLSEVCT